MIKFIFNSLLLPISDKYANVALAAFEECIEELSITQEETRELIQNELHQFENTYEFSETYKAIITAILNTTNYINNNRVSDIYFKLTKDLHIQNPLLSPIAIRLYLSELRLIYILFTEFKMSGSRIRIFLMAKDLRLSDIRIADISMTLSLVSHYSKINQHDISKQMRIDLLYGEDVFGDAKYKDSLTQISEICADLGYPSDLGEDIMNTIGPELTNLKYVQMLHFQLHILNLYDHPIAWLYEFAPRGVAANILFKRYMHLLSTMNPFLNNAKGVAVMTASWPDSKKATEYVAAHSLLNIIQGFDQMSYIACKELANVVRSWIERFVLAVPSIQKELKTMSIDECTTIIHNISISPTFTRGIIEQRLVDFIAFLKHDTHQSLPVRGIGDSVYASNYSKRKLGDAECVDFNKKTITAYEPHAGVLTNRYLEGHIAAFPRALSRREKALEVHAPLNEWQVEVIFVAHRISDLNEQIDKIYSGLKVKFRWITFIDFASELIVDETTLEVFNKIFINRINDQYTPQSVRNKIINILQ